MIIYDGIQALESLIFRCPTEISSHVAAVIQAGLQFIKYDPVRMHLPRFFSPHIDAFV